MLAALRKGQDFFQVMAPLSSSTSSLNFHRPHDRAFFLRQSDEKCHTLPSVLRRRNVRKGKFTRNSNAWCMQHAVYTADSTRRNESRYIQSGRSNANSCEGYSIVFILEVVRDERGTGTTKMRKRREKGEEGKKKNERERIEEREPPPVPPVHFRPTTYQQSPIAFSLHRPLSRTDVTLDDVT